MCCRMSRKGKICAITHVSCIWPFKVIVNINRKVDRPGALGNLAIRKLSATKLVYYSRAAVVSVIYSFRAYRSTSRECSATANRQTKIEWGQRGGGSWF